MTAPVGSAVDFLLVEAACLELICCYRIVVAREGRRSGGGGVATVAGTGHAIKIENKSNICAVNK